MQAYSTQEQPPNIDIVGTHLDMLVEKQSNSVDMKQLLHQSQMEVHPAMMPKLWKIKIGNC